MRRGLCRENLVLLHTATMKGQQTNGTFTKSTTLAAGKYTIVQKAHEFMPVEWRLDMEPIRVKEIAGAASAPGIQWEWGTAQTACRLTPSRIVLAFPS